MESTTRTKKDKKTKKINSKNVVVYRRGEYDLNEFIEMKSKVNGKILDTNDYLNDVALVAVATKSPKRKLKIKH